MDLVRVISLTEGLHTYTHTHTLSWPPNGGSLPDALTYFIFSWVYGKIQTSKLAKILKVIAFND